MNTVSISSINKSLVLFFILFIHPLGQLAIDIYLPSLPAMVLALNSTKAAMQTTLTIYMLGMSISTLVYGILSDRFGRRKILLMGLVIFLLSSIGCSLAPSEGLLLLFRFLQGVGVGGTATVAFAIMVDVFTGPKELVRVTSYAIIVYSFTPIVAPFIGGYIQFYLGWRANFIFMVIYAATLLLALWKFLPETNQSLNKDATNVQKLIRNISEMISCWRYVAFVLCTMTSYAVMITFNVMAPFILQSSLGLNAIQYGRAALIVGSAYVVGNGINTYLVRKFDSIRLILLGFIIVILGAFSLFMLTKYVALNIWTVLAPICIAIAGTGLVFPNSMSAALSIFPEKAGLASSLISCLSLLGCSLASAIASSLKVYDALPLAYMFLVCGILGTLMYITAVSTTVEHQK